MVLDVKENKTQQATKTQLRHKTTTPRSNTNQAPKQTKNRFHNIFEIEKRLAGFDPQAANHFWFVYDSYSGPVMNF